REEFNVNLHFLSDEPAFPLANNLSVNDHHRPENAIDGYNVAPVRRGKTGASVFVADDEFIEGGKQVNAFLCDSLPSTALKPIGLLADPFLCQCFPGKLNSSSCIRDGQTGPPDEIL